MKRMISLWLLLGSVAFAGKGNKPVLKDSEFINVGAGTYSVKYQKKTYPFSVESPYEIQATELTQLQFYKVMRYNPSYFRFKKYCPDSHMVNEGEQICPTFPVDSVTDKDIKAFINEINKQDKLYRYRLPNRHEWDKAARGVKSSRKKALSYNQYYEAILSYAWVKDNSEGKAHPVKGKFPNEVGGYDFRGNLWEVIEDSTSVEDLENDAFIKHKEFEPFEKGRFILMKGGPWYYYKDAILLSDFSLEYRDVSTSVMGFRVVREKR